MKIQDAVTLIRTIEILCMMGEFESRHNVAKNVRSMSRSTVYRKIEKLRVLGFVEYHNVNGNVRMVVSPSGAKFLNVQEELGL